MPSLVLLFVGAVLLLNGLGLLGVVTPKMSAPINAFVGTSLIVVVLFITLPVRGSSEAELDVVLTSVGYLLFAFAYLYVAINNSLGLEGGGLGWYCGWAVLISLYISWFNYTRFDDPKFGAIWLSWSLLFAAFFVVLALNLEWLTIPTGWLTIMQAFTTATIPGAFLLTGDWDRLPTWTVAIAQAAVATVYVLLSLARRPSNSRQHQPRVVTES